MSSSGLRLPAVDAAREEGGCDADAPKDSLAIVNLLDTDDDEGERHHHPTGGQRTTGRVHRSQPLIAFGLAPALAVPEGRVPFSTHEIYHR